MGEETGESAREVGGMMEGDVMEDDGEMGGMMEGDVMEDDGEMGGVMGEKNEKK